MTHRVLTFDKEGACMVCYEVVPREGGCVFEDVPINKGEHLAQWQYLHPRHGWQGFGNRYA